MSDTDPEVACLLCEPAPHPNCEVYAAVRVRDPWTQDEPVEIPVCLAHYEVIQSAE